MSKPVSAEYYVRSSSDCPFPAEPLQHDMHTAEVAFVVRDDEQNKGIGHELLTYLTLLAKRQGLLGFTAEVLLENRPMLHLFEKMGFDTTRQSDSGVWEMKMMFTP